MAARHWLTLTIALCGCLAVTGAEAAKKRGGPKAPPAVTGCTGLVPTCFGLRTVRGASYALADANPWIPMGIGVTVSGPLIPSPCGVPTIRVAKWSPNKRIKCTLR
jgi:hypothetical protein